MLSLEVAVMNWLDNFGHSILNGLLLAAGSFILWLIRTVFTNQKKLEMLEAELKSREKTRLADRADLLDLKVDLKEIRQDIKSLFQK